MEQITKIALAWDLFNSGSPKIQIAKSLNVHRETIGIWIFEIQANGYNVNKFIDKYLLAKKTPRPARQTNRHIKQLIWNIREREKDCCGQKIQYFLSLEHNIKISVPKIYEILAEKYIIKPKWKKNSKRLILPVPVRPREFVQMDTVDFGQIYAFTAVDVFTREVDVLLRPSLTALDSLTFLNVSMNRRFNNHVDLIQTDGGPEFKGEFKQNLHLFSSHHRISRPYRKNEQSFIESFNRTLRKECLGWTKYNVKEIDKASNEVELFLDRYHYHRPHIGLGMRPPLTRVVS